MSNSRTLALLHPGAMGASVGAALVASGHRVRWCSAGRSAASARRAGESGLEPFDTLAALLDGADGVISVCPPEAALDVAGQVARCGFAGVYVDANAVAPATVRGLAESFPGRLVDGGIVGPPALRADTTRLYLSGPRAAEVAGWFAAGALGATAMDGPVGAASALKMCYAAYTKGTAALLLAIRALARAEGVDQALLAEWAISQPDLARRSEVSARGSAPKAWRFVGEMQEIAASFEAGALPGDFHKGAAEIYRRLGDLKDLPDADLDSVIERQLATRGSR